MEDSKGQIVADYAEVSSSGLALQMGGAPFSAITHEGIKILVGVLLPIHGRLNKAPHVRTVLRDAQLLNSGNNEKQIVSAVTVECFSLVMISITHITYKCQMVGNDLRIIVLQAYPKRCPIHDIGFLMCTMKSPDGKYR